MYPPILKQKWPIALWTVVLILLTMVVLKNLPSPENRRLFSDQAAHIAAALSIWHDHDLIYSLDDLARFRQELPAESGPRGAFLKVGDDDQLYYAKPILYALFSAPFVAMFGLVGFTIFNMLCVWIIGFTAFKIFRPNFGALNSSVLICGLLIFSPFMVWTTIAHPDIFIATLLTIGGYLLLRNDSDGVVLLKYIGAFVLGLSVYEKPTFVILIVPLLITQVSQITPRSLCIIAMCGFIGWFAPTAVNLFQDGNIMSYQGLRFYVTGTVGTFPLEAGWKGVPGQGFTDKIFDSGKLLKAIWINLGLLPTKFLDLFVGRQTGLILYFPILIILICYLLICSTWRSSIILFGFIGYLAIYWLAFPTNGYGGSGSYGPRYTMQALPIIIVALLVARPHKLFSGALYQWNWKRYISFAGLIISVLFQYPVIPPRENLISASSQFLLSNVAAYFPFESSLLITIYPMLPTSVSDVFDKRNYLFRTSGSKENCYSISSNRMPFGGEIILFQRGPLKPIPILELEATNDTSVEILADKKVVANIHLKSGIPRSVQLEDIFPKSFHDRLIGEIRWKILEVKTKLIDKMSPLIPALVRISYLNGGSEQSTYTLGKLLSSKEFKDNGVEPSYCWQPDSHSYWSSGQVAGLEFNFSENITDDLDLRVRLTPYFPQNSEPLIIDLYANQEIVGHYELNKNMPNNDRIIARLPKALVSGNSKINLLFQIHNPTQPNRIDQRFLGIAIKDILFSPNIIAESNPFLDETIYFKENGNGSVFLDNGWYGAESWGVWSGGENSSITLPFGAIKEPMQLQFDVSGYVPEEAPYLEVNVFANDIFQNKWIFQKGDSVGSRSIYITPDSITEQKLNIRFNIIDPRSPLQLGRGEDSRLLGIGLRSMQVMTAVTTR
jgi:hypothetical protein